MLRNSVIEKNFRKPDYILLSVVGIILALGIIILASVSAPYALERFGDTYYFLRHQFLWGLIPGFILGFLAFRINLSFLKKIAPAILLINLILLGMVFLPVIGSRNEEASRWISFGKFTFQPSEFLKLTLILYLATWFVGRAKKINSPKDTRRFSQTLVAFLMIAGIIIILLALQPDISTLGVILLTALVMYFSLNTPFWHTALMILLGGGALFSLVKMAPYRANRFLVFLNPEVDPMGIGYQAKQSLIAVGSGGIGGVGLGMSVQKLGFLPQSISDSVFAVFSEETGFIGAIILILLFLIFLWRGFRITKEAKDNFSQLLAVGITSWIVIQTFVNIGAMIRILPLTGIPLPLISYGGSALTVELIAIGLLLNISSKT